MLLEGRVYGEANAFQISHFFQTLQVFDLTFQFE